MRFLVKQGAYALVGAVLLTVFARLDYHGFRVLAPSLVLAALALCVLVLVFGPVVNGARRWFIVGPVSFQPSELAKLALCIWVCAHLARRPVPRTLGELMKPIGLVVLLFGGLILVQPDLGTTISLFLMVAGVLVVSGLPMRVLATAGLAALALGSVAIWMEPYRRARFFAFLDPTQDSQGAGYQTLQAVIGIGSGGITGNGLGEGVQKINFLPEAHTDMIYAVIGEELGLVGSVAVVAAFLAFAWAGFRIALRCRDAFGKRLAVGITTLICGQAAVNLAAVLGIAPLTGIPLPFVSYGGSSLVVLLAGVGILLNIAVNDRVVSSRVPDRGRRDRGARATRARGRGRAARAGSARDVRRVARPRRVAAGS
jgi:cell division protein FtsW